MAQFNPLRIEQPGASDNPLIVGTPTQADAYDYNTSALGQWLAAQRAKSAQMGLWNDQSGMPTPAGWVDAAGQTANALMMGTTAPMTPKLLPAMRVGAQRVTGADHLALQRDHPDIAGHPDSELGFVNPAGRWLTRPQAFQYALEHELIDPKRAAEAQRFKDAMEETGNTRNLFLPSEWLKKYGLAGLMLAAVQQQAHRGAESKCHDPRQETLKS